MFFLQAGQSPVIAEMSDGSTYPIDKFTMDDFIIWGAKIVAKRTDEATKGMSEGLKREFLTFYPPIPPEIQEMRRIARTAEGAQYIIKTCITKTKINGAPVPPIVLSTVLSHGIGVQEMFAWLLADFDTVSPAKPKAPEKDEGQTDPLT